ncbi:hypothetical protein [Lentzea flava]|uniref:hypothetical protein n=1 Tax=Lentzea flava TaxID=103732 RepID=UPI001670C401|nr:hypothetical protein [Lentzea flava]
MHEKAALSGVVAPRDFVRGLSREVADEVLDPVLADFDRVLSGDRWAWTLRSGPRQQALIRMRADRTLGRALETLRRSIRTSPETCCGEL